MDTLTLSDQDAASQPAGTAVRVQPLVMRFVSWLKHTFHRCSHDGCWRKGRDCYLPDNEDGKPDDWACYDHAHTLGYCWSCGQFHGGIESFDFRRSGLCDNCDDQMRSDMGEFDESDECYDPYA